MLRPVGATICVFTYARGSSATVPPPGGGGGGGGGGAVTVTLAVADLPWAVAVICAEPCATAVTTPDEFTVTIDVLPLLQAKVMPEIGVPDELIAVADSEPLWPTDSDSVVGATVMDATVGVVDCTFTVAVAVILPSTAVIVAVPDAFPVTRPEPSTVATTWLLVCHVTCCVPRSLPATSLAEAES